MSLTAMHPIISLWFFKPAQYSHPISESTVCPQTENKPAAGAYFRSRSVSFDATDTVGFVRESDLCISFSPSLYLILILQVAPVRFILTFL